MKRFYHSPGFSPPPRFPARRAPAQVGMVFVLRRRGGGRHSRCRLLRCGRTRSAGIPHLGSSGLYSAAVGAARCRRRRSSVALPTGSAGVRCCWCRPCGPGFGFLLLYLVHSRTAVAAALIIIGVFESVLHPTASTVIADVVPAETRREHFAARRVMSSAGSMVGPAMGALLALHSLGLVFLGAGGRPFYLQALWRRDFSRRARPPAAAPGEEDEEQ